MAGSRITSNHPAERKTERVELRVTPSAKAVIQRATALSGLTAGELAYEAAQRVLETQEVIHLSEASERAFADALLNPPEPTEQLVRALRRHKQIVEMSDASR